jgi:predicted alpha/beta-fold hydrolase
VPPWWLPGGHLQTVGPVLWPKAAVSWRRERWETPDGDFIDLDWAGPEPDRAAPLLALFHGLEGSSSSHYARSIAAGALERGWRCVVPHFRGCSGSLNRLRRAYHSGDSEEIGWILERLEARHAPGGVLYAVGVSLGGNALLKWLGESGAAARLRRAAAVSAPIDLAAAGRALDAGLNRRLYTRVFLLTLKAKAIAKVALEQLALDQRTLAKVRTLREFDDMVTAPLHGFRDADDYWARASCGPWLKSIAIPALIVNARNDPFMPESVLDALQSRRDIPAHVTLDFPRAGGHAAFPGRGRWLARRVLDFLAA